MAQRRSAGLFLRTGLDILPEFYVEGFEVTRCRGYRYHPCDLAVVFGLPNPLRHSVLARFRNRIYAQHKGPILVVESSILGRQFRKRPVPLLGRIMRLRPRQLHGHYRFAVGGAFGPHADFNNLNSPSDRWDKLGIEIKPYRQKGHTVVLLGQTENDASLGGRSAIGWLVETAEAIRRMSERPIVVRLHPVLRTRHAARARARLKSVANLTISPFGRPLAEDLADAHVTISVSSGAAIESLTAGVPAIVMSEDSLAYSICSHTLADLENPAMPAREQWLHDLAYAQWSVEEFADGTAWRHIAPAIERAMTGRTAVTE